MEGHQSQTPEQASSASDTVMTDVSDLQNPTSKNEEKTCFDMGKLLSALIQDEPQIASHAGAAGPANMSKKDWINRVLRDSLGFDPSEDPAKCRELNEFIDVLNDFLENGRDMDIPKILKYISEKIPILIRG